jgi:hypothetical protein
MFYVLQNPDPDREDAVTDFLDVDGSPTGAAPRCEVCGKYTGLMPLVPPVRVELESWSSVWADVAFGPGTQKLISDRLKRHFAEAGLRGFVRCDPAEVVKVTRRKGGAKGPPPRYWLATVGRSRALVDAAASGLDRGDGPVCAECGTGGIIKRWRRLVIQPGTWSGEDVFIARGLPGRILTSERFKSLCDTADLNCHLVPAEKFGFDYYPNEAGVSGSGART